MGCWEGHERWAGGEVGEGRWMMVVNDCGGGRKKDEGKEVDGEGCLAG